MKHLALSILVGLGACASRGQLPLQLSMLQSSERLEAVPQFVELLHEDEGWLRVPVDAGQPKSARLSSGEAIELVVADVPRGQYHAIRVGVVTAAPANSRRTVRTYDGEQVGPVAEGAGLVQDATVVERVFCVDDKREDVLELTVRQAAAGQFPTFQLVEVPSC